MLLPPRSQTLHMNVEIYKCFIASPSDTTEERELCDKVFEEINNTLGQQLNFRIESKKWENNARPSFGTDSQAVITEQLLDNYQLFIGIMWNRFGAQTKRAESGTEEEFYNAYKKYIDQGNVEIMMYFNEALSDVNSLDLDQVRKVRDFKKKVSDLGGLYCSYKGPEEFETKLKRHLNDYFVKKLSQNTDDSNIKLKADKLQEIALRESVSIILKNRFRDSLRLFSNQPVIWIDPVLSKSNDISQNADENYNLRVELKSIIEKPESIIIKSPPQFGLTSLANYFINEAWSNNSLWVYLDARTAKRDTIKKSVEKELRNLNLEGKKIDCLVLDSWNSTENGAKKLLRNLCHEYKDTPIIVMQTIDDISFRSEEPNEVINRNFNVLHLLALPRNQIRKFVCNYNDEKNIGDENIILDKVLKDLDVLNIHRTPFNCMTLLKVSENHFDESPVNRTKMIEMILFVLFNLDDLPTYKIKPDLKDCEYVLGRFCERLVRTKNYRFSRESFLYDLDSFCKEKLLNLEVSVVFDTLYVNNIIMRMESDFVFRSSYWIYYFAAKRMYSDKDFRDYILVEQSYISFPEIIEFYTGIDRSRDDILEILTKDLETACNTVEYKTGLPNDLNPLSIAQWMPTEESISHMQDLINQDVLNSKLPDSLKDKYADISYNQLRPYDQSIQSIMQEYSLTILIQKIKASSRALRNSDYVEPNIKRTLLKEIIRGWKQVSKIIFALTPLLAANGQAAFEGQNFILDGDFGDTIEKRISAIFQANPVNLVNKFKHDLFSHKIGPLIFDAINSETDDLNKHHLILLLISEMPLEWRKYVEDYIAILPKNSFYLYDTVLFLSNMYRYAFASETELTQIRHLLKMGFAKHEFGGGKPKLGELKKISNKVIPKREITSSYNLDNRRNEGKDN
jgi:hypothetical protein